MKELSIEENAKVYTELISRLEDVKDAIKKQNYGIAMDILYKPYPEFRISTSTELKESEGEIVIAALKSGINGLLKKEYHLKGIGGISFDRIIAWLEKQGEQGEIDYDEELKRCKANPIYFFDKYVKVKLKEQKPAWSEEDDEMYKKVETAIDSWYAPFSRDAKEMSEWFKNLKNRVQPQSTWKPSDEQMDALRYVTNFDYGGYKATLVSLYEQLKKLRGE